MEPFGRRHLSFLFLFSLLWCFLLFFSGLQWVPAQPPRAQSAQRGGAARQVSAPGAHLSRERPVSSRGRTAPAPRAAPPLAGRTQLRRGAREARPARPPQGSKAAVAAPRQAGRAPALFLPRRLPYLSGERPRAASPPPATPARPPLRRRRRRGSKGRVGREQAGRGASRKPAGQVGEERKEPRNSRAAREDGARRAGRGLRAAGAARSRDPPPPGHERGPPAGHGVRARPGPRGSCRSASCTAR